MKIATIVGTRPQFIKASPVSKKLKREHTEVLIHTGQHYDQELSEFLFNELNIHKPDYNLLIMEESHLHQIGKMLISLEEVLRKEKPELVFVYGDTNSTLAGAIAGNFLGISVAHIEAGMRSFNFNMIEEKNRILTDHLSSYLFCSTKTAVLNLKKEGISNGVYLVGDVMVDALKENLRSLNKKMSILETFDVSSKEYLFLTLHRKENTDDRNRLLNILRAIKKIDERVIFPIHPRTRKALREFGLEREVNKMKFLTLLPPVGYIESLLLQKEARMILTDSGGIQKEAYILGVPCLTLRDETEWVETVNSGWNVLVGVNPNLIYKMVKTFQPKKERKNLFGTGNSAERIVKIIGNIEIKR